MYISQSTYLKVAELLHNYYNAVRSLNPGEKKRLYTTLCINFYEIGNNYTHKHTLNFLSKKTCTCGKVKFETVK